MSKYYEKHNVMLPENAEIGTKCLITNKSLTSRLHVKGITKFGVRKTLPPGKNLEYVNSKRFGWVDAQFYYLYCS